MKPDELGVALPSMTKAISIERPQRSRSSFYYSFSLLPRDERDAMLHIYDFCRYTDDLVDEDLPESDFAPYGLPEIAQANKTRAERLTEKKRMRLHWWRSEVEKCYDGTSAHPILKGLHKVISRFKVPKQYFMTLIDGVEMDLVKSRYQTFEELQEYCYAVASIVGLICIEIFGYRHETTKDYAVNLGYALQLTNILRDIKQDAEKGRIYLPQEDLNRFGVTEADLLKGNYNWNFIELMKFETDRARHFYFAARAELKSDERITLFAAEIMDAIYFRLLRKIELREFDVFTKRIGVSTPHKILIAFKFWLNRFF